MERPTRRDDDGPLGFRWVAPRRGVTRVACHDAMGLTLLVYGPAFSGGTPAHNDREFWRGRPPLLVAYEHERHDGAVLRDTILETAHIARVWVLVHLVRLCSRRVLDSGHKIAVDAFPAVALADLRHALATLSDTAQPRALEGFLGAVDACVADVRSRLKLVKHRTV